MCVPSLNILLCCFPQQCNLSASNQRSSWSTSQTNRILAWRVPCAAHSLHWEPLLLRRVFLHGGQQCLFKQSTNQTRLLVCVAQAPAPRCGGQFSLLCLPESGCRAHQHPQRSPRQRCRPRSGRCEQRSHLPRHQRQQQQCSTERWQLKTLSSLSPCPHHLPAACHSTPQLKQYTWHTSSFYLHGWTKDTD